MSKEIEFRNIGDLLGETIEEIVSKAGEVDAPMGEALSTGLLDLDAALGGLWPGELVCIAGTSRSGRHSLACQIGMSAARQGAAVLVVSTETGARQVALRVLAADARVDACRLEAGELDEDGWDRVADASGAISSLDLRVCCDRDIGMDDFVALAGDAMEGCGKGLVVLCGIDRVAETSGRDSCWVVERMKALAVDLRVPTVATADMPEGLVRCARMGGYDPSGIRMAVGVDDECDSLVLLDRSVTPEEGAGADAPDFGTAVVAVAKNRHGACGAVELAFAVEYGRFLDLIRDEGSRSGFCSQRLSLTGR